MQIIGLTGSIGMGKTTVLNMFAEKNIPIFDADKAVHSLYECEAAPLIERKFPGTLTNGVVDREKLSAALRKNPDDLKKLEAIIHPLVKKERQKFLQKAAQTGAFMAVLDIPLLFEIGADENVDSTIVVSAPAGIQKERVLARPGMTEEKFNYILANQMPDEEKRRRADFIVETGMEISKTQAQIDKLIETFVGQKCAKSF